MLDELDCEILALEQVLDPAAKSYRYDAMRLDVLRLQRDMVQLQHENEQISAGLEAYRQKQQVDDMRLSLLETTFHHITKPESRGHLMQSIAEEVVKRWQENFEMRPPL